MIGVAGRYRHYFNRFAHTQTCVIKTCLVCCFSCLSLLSLSLSLSQTQCCPNSGPIYHAYQYYKNQRTWVFEISQVPFRLSNRLAPLFEYAMSVEQSVGFSILLDRIRSAQLRSAQLDQVLDIIRMPFCGKVHKGAPGTNDINA